MRKKLIYLLSFTVLSNGALGLTDHEKEMNAAVERDKKTGEAIAKRNDAIQAIKNKGNIKPAMDAIKAFKPEYIQTFKKIATTFYSPEAAKANEKAWLKIPGVKNEREATEYSDRAQNLYYYMTNGTTLYLGGTAVTTHGDVPEIQEAVTPLLDINNAPKEVDEAQEKIRKLYQNLFIAASGLGSWEEVSKKGVEKDLDHFKTNLRKKTTLEAILEQYTGGKGAGWGNVARVGTRLDARAVKAIERNINTASKRMDDALKEASKKLGVEIPHQ